LKESDARSSTAWQRGTDGEECGTPVSGWDRASAIVDVALAAGGKLRAKLESMRQALKAGDEVTALEIARDICGLKERETLAA